MSFLLDGEMAEAHPELATGARYRRMRCGQMPDERALELLGMIHDQLAFQNIKMEVVVKARREAASRDCNRDAAYRPARIDINISGTKPPLVDSSFLRPCRNSSSIRKIASTGSPPTLLIRVTRRGRRSAGRKEIVDQTILSPLSIASMCSSISASPVFERVGGAFCLVG